MIVLTNTAAITANPRFSKPLYIMDTFIDKEYKIVELRPYHKTKSAKAAVYKLQTCGEVWQPIILKEERLCVKKLC